MFYPVGMDKKNPQPSNRRSRKKYEQIKKLKSDPDAKTKHHRENFGQAAARIVREDMEKN